MKHSLYIFICSVVLTCALPSQNVASGFDPGNWVELYATGRNVLDVQMLDFNTIIAVGGRESGDAITTVLRSNDRGQTWDVIIDVPYSPWLQAVHFPSTTRGFAAGYDGMVIRTDDGGISWDTLQLTGNAALRDYNDVYFTSETVGFLVGGNQANDAIRTILKTIDGGDSWQIIEDDLGQPWLQSIQFVSAMVGFASGESGTILKTTDSGNTWTEISLSGNLAARHYNDIRFADEMNGFAVGGQETNDSIRTILRTIDGGASWQPMVDSVASWLNAIDILPSGTLIAVGNDSTILSSADNGLTWTKVMVPTDINRPLHLNAVDFILGSLGVVAGNEGMMLLYEGNVPIAPLVSVNTPIISNSDSIWISGIVNANGFDANVYFDYGPTPSFGTTINAEPSLVTGTSPTYVEALISGAAPSIYYYRLRAENSGGSSLSETRQFYIGNLYDDVNLDFEYWNEQTVNLPNDWSAFGTVTQSPSYDGSVAATLSSTNQHSATDMLIGNVDDDLFYGGFPVSSRPDSVVGYFNYEITAGTEGVVFLALKKDGALLTYEIYTLTGSSAGLFERLSFPVAYSGIEIPDTLVLGISTTNVFVEPEVVSPDNIITVDNLQIISSTPITIPNWDFELWHDTLIAHPTGWYSSDLMREPMLNTTVFRTQDAQHGSYGVTLQSWTTLNEASYLRTKPFNDYNLPSFPVAGRHATFNGYYKFDMQSINDTADVFVQLFKAGVEVGNGRIEFSSSIASYTPFQIELGYSPPNATPDSASIEFRIKNDSLSGPSVLYLDNLSFDGFVMPHAPPLITAVDEAVAQPTAILVYPNPSNGNITIARNQDIDISQVLVYNSNGALVFEKTGVGSSNKLDISIAIQAPGIYFLQLHHRGSAMPITQKLIIQ